MSRLLDLFLDPSQIFRNPAVWLVVGFQLWMLVDALRREEWIWAVCIFLFSFVSALFYYFQVYRQGGGGGGGGGGRLTKGFELPGAQTRRRIKELQARIYHLDKARDHLDLADVYFAQGRLDRAEASYRASLERDPSDEDAVAHLGQCLLRAGRPSEAEPLLSRIAAKDPRHDYGHTLMALAEAQTALGQSSEALQTWAKVLVSHGYARARVQYAELLLKAGQGEKAKGELNEVLADDAHAPKFQRERDRVWIRKAKSLMAGL